MADCNDLFQEFLCNITYTDSNDKLKTGKDAIRSKIKDYFTNVLEEKQPKFFLQGSYSLKTMVMPLNPTDEYDLDDGIYLQHLGNDIDDWPTTKTVSNWIVDAVKGHTKKKPENKKNCVRVIYADGYHIDLPIYCASNGIIYLARLGDDQWISSDAKALNKWFYDRLEKTEQMRSCIKYLKAWKDFKGNDLKGIHITVLVGLNHITVKDRDDDSLTQTIQRIITYIRSKRAIYNPIDSTENLISHWSDKKINRTIEALEKFLANAVEALDEENKGIASKKWRIVFGNRFPKYEEDQKDKVLVVPLLRDNQPPAKVWSEN